MRKALSILASLAFLGCAYSGHTVQDIIDDPGSIMQDPDFAQYKEQRDALETQYLHKEITYADYKEKVEALDQKYNSGVEERNSKIMTNP